MFYLKTISFSLITSVSMVESCCSYICLTIVINTTFHYVNTLFYLTMVFSVLKD